MATQKKPTEGPRNINVRGTELLPDDTRELYRQKLARIALDSMVQFVGFLDAHGTVLEINQVALDAVGIKLSDVEGKPFWTTFWWQVSEENNATLRDSIRRAAQGEFVRWDAEIYGRAGGKETIIIDASLMPVRDEQGKVVFIAAEGRDITEKKAYEREIARQREELAKLDELKTQFFANISHEFRTPLTLMMGPLEDALAEPQGLSAANRERLELAHRNSLRQYKLVNTLLDFSRIEAGRIQSSYAPTDLPQLTAELAGVFRSAIERAGMKLLIDCPPLAQPAYVDREMWEKIVLNLISNAFKFTFSGEIEVSLRQAGETADLVVRDTGTGIPAEEIPRLFDRFHRVKGARGRSYEGSGIGLALVQELVRLHGGTVRLESAVDRGSRFIISIPLGKAHLPADRIEAARTLASTASRADAYVQEAIRWLPDEANQEIAGSTIVPMRDHTGITRTTIAPQNPSHILLVDDNADVREYIGRLLKQAGYEVRTAADGESALRAVRERKPDLILTDIMMPILDGFGLLREVRADAALSATPVILLSARAGEEARIEGMQAGADDYLIKPFSARELLARLESHLRMSRFRQEATAALRASEERFRTLITASSDVVYRMNPDWTEMRHLEGREFIADTHQPSHSWLEKYIHPDDRKRVLAAIDEAIRTKGTFELEHRVLRIDDTLGWTYSRALPILDARGEILEWIGMASDVTERRTMEEAFAQQRRLYEGILTNTPDLAYIFDLDHRFIYANEGLLRMWGKSWSEAIGKNCWELGYEPWHASMHDQEIEQVIATKQPVRGEAPFTGTFGTRIYDYLFVPVLGADGKVEAVAGTTRDISERKQLEASLLEADRRKDEFLATLAHELRNPLAPIRHAAKISKSPHATEAQIKWSQDIIDRQVEHMAHLLDDLLEVSRITRGKVELRRERLDLKEALAAAVETVRPLIEARGHTLKIDMPPARIQVDADPVRLAQIFSNLLTNAAKYTNPGGNIRVQAKGGQDNIVIVFQDNGIGIASEQLPRLFEMFSQATSALDRSEGGLGIGLSLVRGLVTLHGGSIEAHSRGLGQGSEFTLTLPLTTPERRPETASGTAPTVADSNKQRLRVLVADDNRDSADSCAMLLQMFGHEVRTAYSGSEALKLAGDFLPQLALLDIGMPGMNGYEVARHIRAAPWGAKMVLIAVTGWGQTDDKRLAQNVGFDHHLVKPVDLDTLKSVFARCQGAAT